MGTKVPPIGKPNYRGIAGMRNDDLVTCREYYIVRLVRAYRDKDSDTIDAGLAWLEALCSEMRLRGSDSQQQQAMGQIMVVP